MPRRSASPPSGGGVTGRRGWRWRHSRAGRYVGFDHVERLWRWRAAGGRRAVSLPGQAARRVGERIVLRRTFASRLSRTLSGFRCLYQERSCSSRRAGPFRPRWRAPQQRAESRRRDSLTRGPCARATWRFRSAVRSRQPRRPAPARSGWAGAGRSCRTFSSTAKSHAKCGIRVPLVVDRDDRIRVGRRGTPWPRIFGSRSPHKACYS